MELDCIENAAICPWCQAPFPSSEPRPSCNECEQCFCSGDCMSDFHIDNTLAHDYSKPLTDI